jgi:hypothetical protein
MKIPRSKPLGMNPAGESTNPASGFYQKTRIKFSSYPLSAWVIFTFLIVIAFKGHIS